MIAAKLVHVLAIEILPFIIYANCTAAPLSGMLCPFQAVLEYHVLNVLLYLSCGLLNVNYGLNRSYKFWLNYMSSQSTGHSQLLLSLCWKLLLFLSIDYFSFWCQQKKSSDAIPPLFSIDCCSRLGLTKRLKLVCFLAHMQASNMFPW